MNLSNFCAQTGLSPRQVDYWANQGLLGEELTHPGSGHGRDFPPELVPVAKIAKVLVEMFPRDAFKLAKEVTEYGSAGLTDQVVLKLGHDGEMSELMRARIELEDVQHQLDHVIAERDRAEAQLRAILRCASEFDASGTVVRCAKAGSAHNQHTNIPDPSPDELRFTFTWYDDSPGVISAA